MLDKRSSLCGIVVLVSLFFVPNSAFASEIGPRAGPIESILPLFFLISIVVVPIALTYLGIVSLKSFKPNLWNYIHSSRLTKIGLYFLVEGISWFFYRVTQGWFDPKLRFGDLGTDYLVFFPIIPGILLISIRIAKDRLSNVRRLVGIIFLAVGIGWVVYILTLERFYDSALNILILIPGILFFSIGGILIKKHYKNNKKLINS